MADETNRDAVRQAQEAQKRLARMGINIKLRPHPVPDRPRDPDERWRGQDLAPYLEVLRERLEALALPAAAQLELFPAFVPTAGEIVVAFSNLDIVRNPPKDGLDDRQRALVAAVDAQLSAMWEQEQNGAELWTDYALRFRPEWKEVRRMATEALHAFGWTLEVPPIPAEAFHQIAPPGREPGGSGQPTSGAGAAREAAIADIRKGINLVVLGALITAAIYLLTDGGRVYLGTWLVVLVGAVLLVKGLIGLAVNR